ncbi:M56 family metallopeptidase [Sphingomonas jaspsi]|uniref:M56 family metallopeptidase n=1 Tax=Sphingomonas jaspsi TaxID=392409 RepID=UPI0004B0CB7D|nr:M56 family metallopeptidase [Sphingomonas jaspsi]
MTDWLVDTLFATSVLMLLVLILRQPVREKFGSRAAYALWLLPAARALMPTLTETVTRTVPALQPVNVDSTPLLTPLAVEPQLLSAVTPVERTLVDALGGWPTILMTIWLGIAAGLLLRGLFEYRVQRADILKGSVQLARIGSIRLVKTHAVAGPLAFGLIDRVIALPADFERRFDERERCLALDHELAHHRHLDLYTNSFAFVLLSLQWFNPLAWWSYAAFRFDQEAACDARVLDKAMPSDRADYGRAIAKAASGRALLLASALDQKKTLHRRLKSMLNNTPKSRRIGATVAIVAVAALALPLTATRAIDYVDVAAPSAPTAPVAPSAPSAPLAPIAAAALASAPEAPAAPEAPEAPGVTAGHADISFIGNDSVRIDGKTKRWTELSPAERQRIREETAKARVELAQGQAQMERDLANARRDMEQFRNGDFEKEMAKARAEVAAALREIDANAAEMRRGGVDPEQIKAQVRASLADIEKMDVEKIKREALESIDPEKMKAELRKAEQSLADIDSKLDKLDRGDRW